jgi:hypothetical protein
MIARSVGARASEPAHPARPAPAIDTPCLPARGPRTKQPNSLADFLSRPTECAASRVLHDTRLTKNNVRKILIAFGNWAKANRHLPANRPTEFDGLMSYKEPPTKVEIYTPAELGTLFSAVEARRPELLP